MKDIDPKDFFLKLNLGDKILLSLLTAGALAEEALGWLDQFSPRRVYRSLHTTAELDGFSGNEKVLQNALLRLASRKLIEIERKDREKQVRLTELGLEKLFSKFPEIKFHGWPWDGQWRVIIYDIEEETRRLRERLRYFLRGHGFNPIQRSVWSCPYPVEPDLEDFLKKEKLWGKIMVFKTVLNDQDSQKLIDAFYKDLKVRKSGKLND